MTQEEFNNTKFSGNMRIFYKTKIYYLRSVNFEEQLLGIQLDKRDTELDWVRCENCKIIT